ncbi:hypothetical protein GGQ74_000859 [Desulfobaculum xiamenense]|uniref:Restriction system protein Mrr-like N-terminal domain-containing protein n=1 Tax=Desulfobaculum xiamenense TaxID=995050 RepID=A0A846QRC7_9BACT|nr:hypothetical protein [Desulfobaculum xiamenense]NJB67219.1 hypothetical protein [Desulfobaculum xiamenense]
MTRHDLQKLIIEALEALNRKAFILDICKYIWDNHKNELQSSGNLFYTWQYDVRWAGQQLRNKGILQPADKNNREWKLSPSETK